MSHTWKATETPKTLLCSRRGCRTKESVHHCRGSPNLSKRSHSVVRPTAGGLSPGGWGSSRSAGLSLYNGAATFSLPAAAPQSGIEMPWCVLVPWSWRLAFASCAKQGRGTDCQSNSWFSSCLGAVKEHPRGSQASYPANTTATLGNSYQFPWTLNGSLSLI